MSEFLIDWTMFPIISFLLRAYAFLIGLLVAGHFLAMINADKGFAPLSLKIIVSACMAGGVVIAADAYFTGASWSVKPAIIANVLIAFDLWIWSKGFHVCDFVEKLWGKHS